MTRPTAADRIADLTAEVEQQRTRSEATEAELREARMCIRLLEESRDGKATLAALAVKAAEDGERDAVAIRLGLLRMPGLDTEPELARLLGLVRSVIQCCRDAAANARGAQ